MGIPLVMMVGLIFLCILVLSLNLFSGNLGVGIALLVSAFVLPWLWWSVRVVKWKIWAFGNVDDLKTLERRAIASQLIWPHGSWFEKTEIKSKDERKELEWLYEKMESSEPVREKVFDNSLPEETIIHYPRWVMLIYVSVILLGVYLLSVDNWLYGILGIGVGAYQVFTSMKKQFKFSFMMKMSSKGITFPDELIISGENFYKKLDLRDVNTGAFKN